MIRREQVPGVVRISAGMLPVMAATTAAILLFRTGVNELSVGVAVVAAILTLASRVCFRNDGIQK